MVHELFGHRDCQPCHLPGCSFIDENLQFHQERSRHRHFIASGEKFQWEDAIGKPRREEKLFLSEHIRVHERQSVWWGKPTRFPFQVFRENCFHIFVFVSRDTLFSFQSYVEREKSRNLFEVNFPHRDFPSKFFFVMIDAGRVENSVAIKWYVWC